MNKVRSFIKNIGKKKPEEPATPEEIAQLKLEAQKANLKLNIAKAKEAMPKTGLAKFLSKIVTPKERRVYHRRKESKTRSYRDYEPKERNTGLDEMSKRIDHTLGSNKDRMPHIKKALGI